MSFASSRRKTRGGPDGGDGGCGGAVKFKASEKAVSFYHLKKKKIYSAGAGRPGLSKKRKGPKGQDLILSLPPDTWIEIGSQRVLLPKEKCYTIAQGGRGGRGNCFFKTSRNPSPKKAEQGKPGQSLSVRLEAQLKFKTAFLGLKPAGPDVFFSVSSKKNKGGYLFTNPQPRLLFLQKGIEGIELPALEKCSKAFLRSLEFFNLLIFVMTLKSKEVLLTEKKKLDHLIKENCPLFFKKKQLVYLFDPCAGWGRQTSLKGESKQRIIQAEKMFRRENLETIWTVNQLRGAVKKYAG